MVVYKIVASHELPRFDPTKTIKNVLFSPVNARVVSRFIRQYAPVISSSYFLGTALFPIVIFAPTSVAQSIAIVEMLLEVPAYVMSILTLRADLVKLLVASYDYWFFVSTTLIFTSSFAVLLQDLRVVLIASRWIGFQLPILIDANVSRAKPMLGAVIINVVLTLIALVAVSIEAVPGMKKTEKQAANATTITLSVRDLLVNALVTMEILLLRIVIRKYWFIVDNKPTTPTPSKARSAVATFKCVTIRCVLKLDPIYPKASSFVTGHLDTVGIDPDSVQLRHAASDHQFDSTDIVFPRLLQISMPPSIGRLLHTIGTIGIILTFTCGSMVLAFNRLGSSLLLTRICVSAIVSTTCYISVISCFSNRKLLLSVCASFDYLFLTLQFSFAHASVCDMFHWRLLPTAIVACLWFWCQWVLMLDTMTPHMKQHLRFSHSREVALLFLVLYLLVQIAFAVKATFDDSWGLQNRVVMKSMVFHKTLEYRVLPFFASRMLTVTVWTVRLIWRFSSQADSSELIMLRGQVEFDYDPSSHTAVTVIRPTSIVPTSTTTSPTIWETSTTTPPERQSW